FVCLTEMGVMPEIAQAVEEMDWLLPTDIQAESIPLILGGGDVLMAAETGSGKTGAFSIPVIQIVYETLKDQMEGKKGKATIKTGGAVLNKWQMNPYDRGSAFAIGSDGLCCQSREIKEWHGCRATRGVTKGKYYYEVSCHDQGLCRVGWSTMQASLDLGTDKFGFGFGGTGKKSHNKQFDSYGEEFTMHDTIGCYLDTEKGQIKFSKNGKDLGLAFEIPPHIRNQALFAACVLKNAELKFNFGEEDFKFPPKDGYVGLCKAPEGCVVKSQHSGSAQVVQTQNLPNAPKALIVEPSRELAEQTLNNVKQFKKYVDNPKLRELLIIGGVAARDQLSVLEQGVDIVVGTPGRLDDLIATGKINLSQVRFLVLDEADGLLLQGYSDFINRIHSQIPQITSDGKRLQITKLHSLGFMEGKKGHSTPQIRESFLPKVDSVKELTVEPKCRLPREEAVRPLSRRENCIRQLPKVAWKLFLICILRNVRYLQLHLFYFISMQDGLLLQGYSDFINRIHSQIPQITSDGKRLQRGDVRFLICTDVAARGIDIHGVPYVINVTLPDEKQNYVHRIGRVGRAERMGLAISLVAKEKEKVWYHVCSSRGKGCYNTRLKEEGGCTIWYNEMQLLGEIEEHLNCTITQVEPDIKVPVDDFDGKVTYGQKRALGGGLYKGHVDILAPTVQELAALEKEAQTSFLHLGYLPNQLFRTF
ncbi:DDX1 helicase, partial [Toxostoma redivivum]|nr:DDX1 helicase [Toxostoma redivivum]